MRKAAVHGQPMFDKDKGITPNYRSDGKTTTWSFACELARVEEK